MIARPERRAVTSTPVPPREIAPVSFKNVSVSPGPVMVPPPAQLDLAPAPRTVDETGVVTPEPARLEDVSAPASPETGVSMVLEFDQDSWTEVSADGRNVFSGMVRRGIRREFQAREGFRLTLGNAGGVRVSVDGRTLEPLGEAGQVVRNLPLPSDRQG
jgi:cytoskeleton protein RodZ